MLYVILSKPAAVSVRGGNAAVSSKWEKGASDGGVSWQAAVTVRDRPGASGAWAWRVAGVCCTGEERAANNAAKRSASACGSGWIGGGGGGGAAGTCLSPVATFLPGRCGRTGSGTIAATPRYGGEFWCSVHAAPRFVNKAASSHKGSACNVSSPHLPGDASL